MFKDTDIANHLSFSSFVSSKEETQQVSSVRTVPIQLRFRYTRLRRIKANQAREPIMMMRVCCLFAFLFKLSWIKLIPAQRNTICERVRSLATKSKDDSRSYFWNRGGRQDTGTLRSCFGQQDIIMLLWNPQDLVVESQDQSAVRS